MIIGGYFKIKKNYLMTQHPMTIKMNYEVIAKLITDYLVYLIST